MITDCYICCWVLSHRNKAMITHCNICILGSSHRNKAITNHCDISNLGLSARNKAMITHSNVCYLGPHKNISRFFETTVNMVIIMSYCGPASHTAEEYIPHTLYYIDEIL